VIGLICGIAFFILCVFVALVVCSYRRKYKRYSLLDDDDIAVFLDERGAEKGKDIAAHLSIDPELCQLEKRILSEIGLQERSVHSFCCCPGRLCIMVLRIIFFRVCKAKKKTISAGRIRARECKRTEKMRHK